MLYTTRFVITHGIISKCHGYAKDGAYVVVVENPPCSMMIGEKYIHTTLKDAKQSAAHILDEEISRLKKTKLKVIAQPDDIQLS